MSTSRSSAKLTVGSSIRDAVSDRVGIVEHAAGEGSSLPYLVRFSDGGKPETAFVRPENARAIAGSLEKMKAPVGTDSGRPTGGTSAAFKEQLAINARSSAEASSKATNSSSKSFETPKTRTANFMSESLENGATSPSSVTLAETPRAQSFGTKSPTSPQGSGQKLAPLEDRVAAGLAKVGEKLYDEASERYGVITKLHTNPKLPYQVRFTDDCEPTTGYIWPNHAKACEQDPPSPDPPSPEKPESVQFPQVQVVTVQSQAQGGTLTEAQLQFITVQSPLTPGTLSPATLPPMQSFNGQFQSQTVRRQASPQVARVLPGGEMMQTAPNDLSEPWVIAPVFSQAGAAPGMFLPQAYDAAQGQFSMSARAMMAAATAPAGMVDMGQGFRGASPVVGSRAMIRTVSPVQARGQMVSAMVPPVNGVERMVTARPQPPGMERMTSTVPVPVERMMSTLPMPANGVQSTVPVPVEVMMSTVPVPAYGMERNASVTMIQPPTAMASAMAASQSQARLIAQPTPVGVPPQSRYMPSPSPNGAPTTFMPPNGIDASVTQQFKNGMERMASTVQFPMPVPGAPIAYMQPMQSPSTIMPSGGAPTPYMQTNGSERMVPTNTMLPPTAFPGVQMQMQNTNPAGGNPIAVAPQPSPRVPVSPIRVRRATAPPGQGPPLPLQATVSESGVSEELNYRLQDVSMPVGEQPQPVPGSTPWTYRGIAPSVTGEINIGAVPSGFETARTVAAAIGNSTPLAYGPGTYPVPMQFKQFGTYAV